MARPPSRSPAFVGLLALAAVLGLPVSAQQGGSGITGTITKGMARVRIAIPDAEISAGDPEIVREIVETIRADLEFSGYFDLIDPRLYGLVPSADSGVVRHDDWISIGADSVTALKVGVRNAMDPEISGASAVLTQVTPMTMAIRNRYCGIVGA